MNKGRFKKGQTPWNKGIMGTHFSSDTEFKTGEHVGSNHPCWKGGLQLPTNDCAYLHTGANSRTRRPKWLYEQLYGTLPEGCVIYHKDGNNKNDDLWNLEVISRAELLRRNNFKNKT